MSGQSISHYSIGSDGGITRNGSLYEKYLYDMANKKILVQTDGCCTVSRYAIANRFEALVPDSFYAAFSLDGNGFKDDLQKSIHMLGRMQRTEFFINNEMNAKLYCETFLDEESRAVFQQYTLRAITKEMKKAVFRLDFGFLLNTAAIGQYSGKKPFETVNCNRQNWGWYCEAVNGWGFSVISDSQVLLREVQDAGLHFSAEKELSTDEETRLRLIYLMDHKNNAGLNESASLLDNFEIAHNNALSYSNWLSQISESREGNEKAQFAASVNCGLSNYKEVDGFKGFFAGVNYSFPARTYYRDGFFTALAALKWKPEWVAEQICTLALGIDENGKCPSAVIDSENVFWNNHLDSPQYFVLLLYEYIKHTGNLSFLEKRIKGRGLLGWAELITRSLLDKADSNGLLRRESGNRHDWADNVFREGYVTYIEALYCQTVKVMGKLKIMTGSNGDKYEEKAAEITAAIDKYLWDEELGWYINYTSENYTEKNLSIDTVLLAWFDIVPENRARLMLQNMERKLETINNNSQPYGDWGVMCCFPFYGKKAHLVEKSSYNYVYHNGSDWPFWSCVYAMTKQKYGMESRYAATRWFTYGLEHGWNTPVEYYNPITGKGSNLQAWSALGANVLLNIEKGD